MGIEILYNNFVTKRGYRCVLNMTLEALEKGDYREVAKLSGILIRSDDNGKVTSDLREEALKAQRQKDVDRKETCNRLLKIYVNQLFETDDEYVAKLKRMRGRRAGHEQALGLTG